MASVPVYIFLPESIVLKGRSKIFNKIDVLTVFWGKNFFCTAALKPHQYIAISVGDPDPRVFRPPGSGAISQRYGSGSISH